MFWVTVKWIHNVQYERFWTPALHRKLIVVKYITLTLQVHQLCTCLINHAKSRVTKLFNTESYKEAFRGQCNSDVAHASTNRQRYSPVLFSYRGGWAGHYSRYFTRLLCTDNETIISLQHFYQVTVIFSAPANHIIRTQPPPLFISLGYPCQSNSTFRNWKDPVGCE